MPALAKLAVAVIGGGVALGSMLGNAAHPVMKEAPEAPWRDAVQSAVAASPVYQLMVEAPPEDLSPYGYGNTPTWAREELVSYEPDYPEWTYSELVDEKLADVSVADEPDIAKQQQPEGPAVVVEASAPQVESAQAPLELSAPANLAGLY